MNRSILIVLTLVITPIFSIGQEDTSDSKFVLLEYGFPPINNYLDARREVSKKWDIQFKRIANCIVSEKLVDSVKHYNDSVIERISMLHGNDWKKRFDNEVEILNRKITEAENNEKQAKTLVDMKAAYSSTPSGAIEQPESNILFRGYDNKVVAAVNNNGNLPVVLTGENCTISIHESGEYFVVRPDGGKSKAYVMLNLIDNDSLIQIKKSEYRILSLPDPIMYWGKIKSGEKGNPKARTLEVRYLDGMAINPKFEIMEWVVLHENKKMHGTGGDLTPAESIFIHLVKHSTVEIVAKVKAPDGRVWQVNGIWKT